MVLQYECKLCGQGSVIFSWEELANLHVLVTHPESGDDYEKHVQTVSMDTQLQTRSGDLPPEMLSELDQSYLFLLQDILPGSPSHPVIYQRLSEMLALIARHFARRPAWLGKARESLDFLTEFSRLDARSSVLRLLAESDRYRMRLLQLLSEFGYIEEDFCATLQSDEDEISRLLNGVLRRAEGQSTALAVSDSPYQAQASFDLGEKISVHLASQESNQSVYQSLEDLPTIFKTRLNIFISDPGSDKADKGSVPHNYRPSVRSIHAPRGLMSF